ncbi:MAG: hypothetical protein PF692_08075 [Kiritimatiellae bacterium]|jgi:hypothetical protein|nr:hypothetical protein [Kiritimatiellia bacterium]
MPDKKNNGCAGTFGYFCLALISIFISGYTSAFGAMFGGMQDGEGLLTLLLLFAGWIAGAVITALAASIIFIKTDDSSKRATGILLTAPTICFLCTAIFYSVTLFSQRMK